VLARTADGIRAAVARFHEQKPLMDGIAREAARLELGCPPLFDAAVAMLLEDGALVAAGNALAAPDHVPAADAEATAAMDRIAARFSDAGLEFLDLSELPSDLSARTDLPLLIRFLERDGHLVRLGGDRYIAAQALSEAVAVMRTQLSTGQPLGIADFRSVMNLSRKHLIPLLEHFDRNGITRRAGESRVLAE
jgi:selenocysteine-specific elongation factor